MGDDGSVKRAVTVSTANDHLVVEAPDGTVLVDVEAHANRHSATGADPIPQGALRFTNLSFVLSAGTTESIAAGGTSILQMGVLLVFCGSGVVVEAYDSVGGAWKTIIAAGGAGFVISDGTNFRARNTGTTTS
ncbi:MAG: hypothetical protein QXW40_07965, partial [Thermofilum sp.]